MSFGFIAPEHFQIIWIFNLSIIPENDLSPGL
jgi:hypothetical protein